MNPPTANGPNFHHQVLQIVEELIAPLVPLMEPGKASLAIEGMASDHGEVADRLEAYTRPGLLVALWLQAEPLLHASKLSRDEIGAWYLDALRMGTDPNHPEYFGDLRNYHQHAVEVAIFTISLTVAREWLWDPLTREERDRVANWLGQVRGNARPWNNHFFFNVLTMEFLEDHGYDEPGDRGAIAYLMDQLQSMHQGGGWFIDGVNETFDHYNAYAFHTYGLWWALRYGHRDLERAAWWKARSSEFVVDYAHLYAESGEVLPFGRSITYRFNGLGVFGMAALHGIDTVPMGQMKRICRKNLEFFTGKPIQQSQGVLSVGWTTPFEQVAEAYTCAGSPYWASKGLLMLMLPPDHDFWNVEEAPIPSEQGDFTRVVKAPGFLIRGTGGNVELINAGSRCSGSIAQRFGAWKWSRLAFRTGMGFLVDESRDLFPFDATLTGWHPDRPGKRFGRTFTIPTEVSEERVSYGYCFGDKNVDFYPQIHSHTWWNHGWLLTVHEIVAHDPGIFALGSFALGLEDGNFKFSDSVFPYNIIGGDGSFVAAQVIMGFLSGETEKNIAKDGIRRHLNHPHHSVPILKTGVVKGRVTLAGLIWAGSDAEEGAPWKLTSAGKGDWTLKHPKLGDWRVEHSSLPKLEL